MARGRGRGKEGGGGSADKGGAAQRGERPPGAAAPPGRNLPVISNEDAPEDKVQRIPEDAGFVDMSVTDQLSDLSLSSSGRGSASASSARPSASELASRYGPAPVYRGPVVMAKKPAQPGKVTRPGTQQIKLTTNLLELKLPSNLIMWQYHLTISKGTGKGQKVLSKGSGDDYHRYIKREKCWDVFQKLITENAAVFNPSKHNYVYDRCTNLMSDLKISGIEFGKKAKSFNVAIYDRDIEDKEVWTVEVQMMESEGVVVSDISSLGVPNLAERNMEPKRILEIITSQVLYKKWGEGGATLVTGNKAYDLNTVRDLPNGCGAKYTMQGWQKSAKLTSTGPGGRPGVAMSIDFKFGGFFKECSLEEFLKSEFPRLDFNRGLCQEQKRLLQEAHSYMKDIVIKTTHTKGKTFTCRGFNLTRSVKDHTFDVEGKSTNIVQYYRQKYQTGIKYPNMPALRDERGSAYPIEVCKIAPYQRVPITKQNPKQMQSMIKDAAVLPSERMAIMMKQVHQNQLNNNDTLTGLGIQLLDSVMTVAGRLLPIPAIGMHKRVNMMPNGEYRMRDGGKFMIGGGARKIAVLILATNEREYCQKIVSDFLAKFKQMGNQYGTTLPTVSNIYEIRSENDVIGHFNNWINPGMADPPDFVLSILPNNGGEQLHNLIKYQELMTGIQTQNIRLQTIVRIMNPRGGDNILANVLCKTNIKLGGVDNTIHFNEGDVSAKWFRKGVMICGLDVNHPPPQNAQEKRMNIAPSEPSVVGLVANTGAHMFCYTGEHWFVSPRAENQVEGLDARMTEMCGRYFDTHRTMPSTLIFFRDGVSEGQFAHVMDTEVPLMRKGLMDLAQKLSPEKAKSYKPKLTVIIVRKRHNERLYPSDMKQGDRRRAPEQNVQPGTVVDNGMTHPTDWEYYLNAHIALQGTCKPAKYTVVIDENGFNQDDIQGVSHALCYGHQIIQKAVSLPVPVFAAHDMAKRGKALFRAWQRSTADSDGVSEGSSAAELDYTMLSEKLAIGNQAKLKHKKHFA